MVLTDLHVYFDAKLGHSSEDDQQFVCRSSGAKRWCVDEAKRWSMSLSLKSKIHILEVDT